jgi:acyl-CoA synthetase (AMP-forming)/AMP-acid ligase II
MPKATFISAGRWINTARGMGLYLNLKPGDKMYTCLPLYHGAAQGLCTLPTIYSGSAISLGRKFSHRTFWPEVFASGANRLQYVGELCRYLVNAPVHPLEREHKIEEAWGNGMRPDVWEKFRQRFNIPVIHELYAATDGTGTCFNYNRNAFTRDAIALRGLLWNRWNNGNEVHARIDPDTEDIVRGADGFVTPSNVGEPGEVLHRVDPAMKEAVFRGYYKNESASDKRWMRDAFEPGDLYFRSGDVMRQDADSFL